MNIERLRYELINVNEYQYLDELSDDEINSVMDILILLYHIERDRGDNNRIMFIRDGLTYDEISYSL